MSPDEEILVLTREVHALRAELVRVTGWAAKYFEGLIQAHQCCARPSGVCFDPTLIDKVRINDGTPT